jgi:hypothetical protein
MREGDDRPRRQCDLTWPRCSPFLYFPPHGQVAQLVEQRTENPRVGGSIPSLAIQHDCSSSLRVLTYSNIPTESRSSTGS